jgi:hypothetical protein
MTSMPRAGKVDLLRACERMGKVSLVFRYIDSIHFRLLGLGFPFLGWGEIPNSAPDK